MASAAPAHRNIGVRECMPSGMGFTADLLDMILSPGRNRVGSWWPDGQTPGPTKASSESGSMRPPVLWFLLPAMRPLQLRNVDLGHLHHGSHHALRFRWIRVFQQLNQHARSDLPGQSEFVLEPAALARRATR